MIWRSLKRHLRLFILKCRKKPRKIERLLIGDGNYRLDYIKDYNIESRDLIILGDLLGFGKWGQWTVDLTAILKEYHKIAIRKNFPNESYISGLIWLSEAIIIEEVTHSLGEIHHHDSEDWTNFILKYVI